MLAPWWCVNEGTTNWFVFANATNDQFVSLTKSALKLKEKIIKIIKTSGIRKRLAVSCHKMRALVNSTQNSTILCQHTIICSLIPNGIFEKFTRNSLELKLTLETMSKLDKLTLEMQPARDPSNCIKTVVEHVEYKLPLAGTGPNHNI